MADIRARLGLSPRPFASSSMPSPSPPVKFTPPPSPLVSSMNARQRLGLEDHGPAPVRSYNSPLVASSPVTTSINPRQHLDHPTTQPSQSPMSAIYTKTTASFERQHSPSLSAPFPSPHAPSFEPAAPLHTTMPSYPTTHSTSSFASSPVSPGTLRFPHGSPLPVVTPAAMSPSPENHPVVQSIDAQEVALHLQGGVSRVQVGHVAGATAALWEERAGAHKGVSRCARCLSARHSRVSTSMGRSERA